MEIRKISSSLFLIFSFLTALPQWIQEDNPSWSQGHTEFQLCDVQNGKVLFLSKRLAQVMGQGTMFETRISRLHEYDLCTGRETTLFPKDWNFPEGFACFGYSENEVFYESKMQPNGTNGKWSKIFLYQRNKDNQFGDKLKLTNFDQDGFDCIHPVFIEKLNLLIFSSNKVGGAGGYDLYGTYRLDSTWSPVFSLGNEVNTAHNEFFPSARGNDLIFTRSLDNGSVQNFKVPLNTQFIGVLPFSEFNGASRLVPIGTNQMVVEKDAATTDWFESIQKKESYSLLLVNQSGHLQRVSVRIERNEGMDFNMLETNERGFTSSFQFSANEKVKISLQGNWKTQQMPIYAKLYSSKGNLIRTYKFNSNGEIQFELLDFIFSKVNFLRLYDESKLIEYDMQSDSFEKLTLYFMKNESQINRIDQKRITEWCNGIESNSNEGMYHITAFSSFEGKKEKNRKLAQQRMNSGKNALINCGVSSTKIIMQVGGVEEKMEGGRRVEIEFIPLRN